MAEGGFDVFVLSQVITGVPTETTLIKTAAKNKEGFTKHQLMGARAARDVYKTLGFPSMRDFVSMVHDNLIRNYPIMLEDIKNAHTIYGPDVASLKGKTVRKASPVVRTDYIYVPRHIFDQNKHVVVAGDIMYVTDLRFLVTVSRGINMITVEYLPDRKSIILRTP